jgi:uncharacterized glyoxalase superfamily protein PhnB
MGITLNPHLNFRGNAREAMEFYERAWGDTFGMCTDRFGIQWLLNITAPEAPEG